MLSRAALLLVTVVGFAALAARAQTDSIDLAPPVQERAAVPPPARSRAPTLDGAAPHVAAGGLERGEPRALKVHRVYVAPLSGPTSDATTVSLIEDRVLVAAKSLPAQFEVVGARDLQGLLDVEAASRAVGCDTTSCANEVADALNADELVTGQLGRIGETWQLTLTRTQRGTLKVLGRSARDARGDTPEGLLPQIPDALQELFALVDPAVNTLAIVGVSLTAIGTLTLGVGFVGYVYSWVEYLAAAADLAGTPAPADIVSAQTHRSKGEGALPLAYIAGATGIVVVLVGAATWALAPATAPAPVEPL